MRKDICAVPYAYVNTYSVSEVLELSYSGSQPHLEAATAGHGVNLKHGSGFELEMSKGVIGLLERVLGLI